MPKKMLQRTPKKEEPLSAGRAAYTRRKEEKQDEAPIEQFELVEVQATRQGKSEAEAEAEAESEVPDESDEPTLFMRAHYIFDNWMARQSSPFVLVAFLVVLIIILGGIGNFAVCDDSGGGDGRRKSAGSGDSNSTDAGGGDGDESKCSIGEGMWTAWLYLNDPAAHAGNAPGMDRFVGGVISMIGLFIFAMLMGFVFDLITVNMEELRKGKSKVVEREHTLILGWSDKIYAILLQLCDANECGPNGERGGTVVILATPGGLAPESKEDMIIELDERIDEERRKGTLFVVRVGSPMLTSDLKKVAASVASSIIILCDDDGDASKADAQVLRTVVALGSALPQCSPAHIVTQIRDIDCVPLLDLVCGDRIETIVSHDIVGRLMVMSVRQPGLAKIYEQLLGFEGDEFYFKPWPQVIGKRYGDLFQYFIDAIPLGVRTADGFVVMKPSLDRVVKFGEEVLFLAEDDETYKYEENSCTCAPGKPGAKDIELPEKMLVVGWRRDFRDMVMLIDELVAEGSELHIMCDKEECDREEELEDAGLDFSALKNLELVHHEGHARRHFEKLPLEEFSSCLIVADEEAEDDLMNSDSQCIQTLLLIRDVQMKRRHGDPHSEAEQRACAEACPILVETLDVRTQDCIKTSKSLQAGADFLQSNEMVSRVLAMVSEDRSVNLILSELLGGDGASIALKPAEPYLNDPNEQLSFLEFSKRTHDFDEVLLGFQLYPAAVAANTIMNPRDKNVKKNWQGCLMIVLMTEGVPQYPHLHD